jgi:hypothetical protein
VTATCWLVCADQQAVIIRVFDDCNCCGVLLAPQHIDELIRALAGSVLNSDEILPDRSRGGRRDGARNLQRPNRDGLHHLRRAADGDLEVMNAMIGEKYASAGFRPTGFDYLRKLEFEYERLTWPLDE